MTRAAFHAHGDRFENKLIARDDGVAHLHLIHAQKHGKFAGVFQLLAQQDPPSWAIASTINTPGMIGVPG